MDNSLKLMITCLLFSCTAAVAQDNVEKQDVVSSRTDAQIEYGRGIGFSIKESTAAASGIDADALTHKTSINPSNTLFGMIPGLQVLQNAGNVWDDGATLYIRGLGTNNSKTPLILVDGFERSIADLTVQEIESVTVLKDAASLSLYGGRGANGVVYIKTKRGCEATPRINFSYEFNMGTPRNLPDFVDGPTYARALNEAMTNDGLTPMYSLRDLEAFDNQTYPYSHPNVDWWDEALRDHSFGDNVNFSIQGGGKIAKYFAQINFLDDRGLLQPTDDNEGYSTQFKYSKLNVRTNLDIRLGKTSTLELSMLGNFSEHNRPGKESEDIFKALYNVPSGAFPIKSDRGLWGGTSVYANNPIAFISGSGYARSQSRSLLADATFKQDLGFLLPGLTGKFRIGLDNYDTYWDSNVRDFAYDQVTLDWDNSSYTHKKLREETPLKFGKELGGDSRHFNLGAELNYDRHWNKHHLSTTLVYSMDKNSLKGQNESYSFIDVAGQIHYAYNERYIVDVAMSGTGSSILEPDHRWGFFPAVSAAWVLSEESFLKADWLDLFKLRASFGMAGRADYKANLYKTFYAGGGDFLYGDTPKSISGMREKQLGVTGLTYEKSHKWNVGIDFMAFHKLSLTLDAYYDHRTDILVKGDGVISSVLGAPVPKHNDGIVNSYGVELGANWTDKIGEVSYLVGGQFSFNRNEIKNMNEEFRPYKYLEHTGNPLGQIFGYEVEGIYQNQDEIDNRGVEQKLGDVRPGDLRFKDQNNDKVINEYDKVALGYNDVCPEIYYAFNLGAEYKGIGFYAQFQGAAHYSQILNTPSVFKPMVGNNTISEHYYANRWTEDNKTAKYPRLSSTGSPNNYNTNSLWVADASFLKLRTLEVYYQLPQSLLKSVKFMKSAKIFARAHDLFSIDSMDVVDPESVGNTHPLMTQYTFGFNLGF